MRISEWITHKLIIKVRAFCLSENPLLAPGNVLPDEGIIFKKFESTLLIARLRLKRINYLIINSIILKCVM